MKTMFLIRLCEFGDMLRTPVAICESVDAAHEYMKQFKDQGRYAVKIEYGITVCGPSYIVEELPFVTG